MKTRVRFNDSWFVYHGSSYVFTNHILAESTYFKNHIEWTEHKITVLKPANKYQIIRHYHEFEKILIHDSQHQPFLHRAKENYTNWKDGTINHSNIYYLIYCDAGRAFHKIIQRKKFDMFCGMEMYNFEELP